MNKINSLLFTALQKLSTPKTLLILMLILPVLLSAAGGQIIACDVGGNIGGCTGG